MGSLRDKLVASLQGATRRWQAAKDEQPPNPTKIGRLHEDVRYWKRKLTAYDKQGEKFK